MASIAQEGVKGQRKLVAAAGGSGLATTVVATLANGGGGGMNRSKPQTSSRTQPGPGCTFTCGLIAGVTQAGLFNPFDRALYLSVKNRRAFLLKENFRRPYQGFLQTVGGRTIQGGIFFPLEQFSRRVLPQELSPVLTNFMAGSVAGAFNAVILNPLSAIKYRTWGRDDAKNRGMMQEAKGMFSKGGLRPFCNGMLPTILRDVVFGGTYTVLRCQSHEFLSPEWHWVGNMAAAGVATVASAPLNLARNVQYATKPSEPRQSIVQVFIFLKNEVAAEQGVLRKLSHLQQRLRVGWGTARVAIGMAFGNQVYDVCVERLCD